MEAVEEVALDEFEFKPVAHDVRLTFSRNWLPQDKELKCLEDIEWKRSCKREAKSIIKKATDLSYFDKWTAGLEEFNRKGDPCKFHLHLRFISSRQTASMRKQFKRWAEDYLHNTRGNVNFMFKAVVIRDETDFFGYPLKQNLSLSLCGGFGEEKLNALHEGAKSQYIKVCEAEQAKLDRTDKKETLFKTVLFQIENTQCTKTKKFIAQNFLQFYIENEYPINSTTIRGYVTQACLYFKLITPDELLGEWGY